MRVCLTPRKPINALDPPRAARSFALMKQILRAETAAVIAEIHVAVGDAVPAGGLLITSELMKMRHEMRADVACIVTAVHVAPGDALTGGERLLTFTPGGDAVAETVSEGPRADFAEFEARLALLQDNARPDVVAKRHAKGLRTARENIADLLDEGSFTEYGGLAVAAMRRVRPADDLAARTPADGIVVGTGTVDGREVAVMAVDYTVLAGTQGYHHHHKMDRVIEVARAKPGRAALPIILFAEGGGGRPNDTDAAEMIVAGLNITSFRHFAAHKGPKIGVVAGYCFAGNAALFGVCDLRIGTKDSNIGMGGPAMIEGGGLGRVAPTDIGPSDVHSANGVIDVLVEDEAAAVVAVKHALSLNALAPVVPGEEAALRDAIPTDRTKAYDMRTAVKTLVDEGSWLELRRGFGAGMITGFARVEGRAVGLLANNPLHLGGAIDAAAADKGARFLQLCDAWGLPALTLCDTPGFMVGPAVEETGQVAHVSRLFLAGAHFSQPMITVILRKAYGLGAMAMAGGGFDRPDFCCAWPTGEIGAMGLEGAVKLGAREHLAAIADDAAREAEYQRLVDELYERGKALNAASLLEFDAVIDPAETRAVIARALQAAGPALPSGGYVDAW